MKNIRCEYCGQFIAYKDIPDKVSVQFIPETEFTNEATIFAHKKCESGEPDTSKCVAYKCNHPLDPEEWDCDEKKCIKLGECKYL